MILVRGFLWSMAPGGGYANHSFFWVNSNLLSDRYMDTNQLSYSDIFVLTLTLCWVSIWARVNCRILKYNICCRNHIRGLMIIVVTWNILLQSHVFIQYKVGSYYRCIYFISLFLWYYYNLQVMIRVYELLVVIVLWNITIWNITIYKSWYEYMSCWS